MNKRIEVMLTTWAERFGILVDAHKVNLHTLALVMLDNGNIPEQGKHDTRRGETNS